MDRLDHLILDEMLEDATQSYVQVAKKIGTTPYTVRRRFETMKKQGKILGSHVSLDLAKLGYQGKAFLFITVGSEADRSETIAYLKKIKNVIVVTELIGPYEIMAVAPISDLKSIQTLVKEAKNAPNVGKVKVACINDTKFPISPNFGKLLKEKLNKNANPKAKTRYI
jgi:DNA-binding Lrp family transcriptional regulator